MNRLQKKCVLATTGFHLLLLVILFVGPAFFWSREKPDDTPVLDMIPANLVDSVSTGVQNAQPPPPAPAPVVTPPPQPAPPAPTPPEPKPIVQPTPAPTPTPTLTERVEKFFKPAEEKPVPAPTENPSHTPKVNLTPVTRVVPKNSSTPTKTTTDNSKAIKSALRALRANLSSPTTVAPVGNSSAAAANYAQVVKSVYEQAWMPPDETASDDANVKVRVTIASDGRVISAEVIGPSGDTSVDRSVQNTLDRVTDIAPFPAGSTDTERTYIINFNLKAKRLLG
jgi:TonB family protein